MIKTISLRNFRNHHQLDLQIEKPLIYIYGPNGSGKTSILESIYFCATTKSHRAIDEKEMIQNEKPFAQVKIATEKHRYEIVLSKDGKRISVDGIEKRRISEFIGHFTVVMFAPSDLKLITGTPSDRRQFLDLEMSQIKQSYVHLLNKYKKILKQRNALLKRIQPDDDYTFLNILGEQLYEVGVQMIKERQIFIKKLNDYLITKYQLFSDHKISLIYKPDMDEKAYKKHLEKQQKTDILYQTTLAGPHRDDFYVDFNGFDARRYASQGQQRLIVIALKFGLLSLIENETNKQAILLLDDVLSELDFEKQHTFINNLPDHDQIIMNSALEIKQAQAQMVTLKKEITYVKL